MIVVDASVAIKWFVAEADHVAAIQVLRSTQELIAPDLIILETLNVLRRKSKRGEVTGEQLTGAAAALVDCFDELVSSAALAESALKLATRLDHSVYDCAYLACAMEVDGVLVSADRILTEKASRAGLGSSVRLLAPPN